MQIEIGTGVESYKAYSTSNKEKKERRTRDRSRAWMEDLFHIGDVMRASA